MIGFFYFFIYKDEIKFLICVLIGRYIGDILGFSIFVEVYLMENVCLLLGLSNMKSVNS